MLLLLVGATAAGPGRIVKRCRHLEGQAVTLHIWGTVPRAFGGDVVVAHLWALGAGLHLHVRTPGSASSLHVKVAQPRGWSIDESSLTIEDAKYVQVSGKTAERVAGQLAVELRVGAGTASGRPDSPAAGH
ncbi:MAG TPA: hypothetical protein VGE98_01090 [Thermoanaerobaculia bacterium]